MRRGFGNATFWTWRMSGRQSHPFLEKHDEREAIIKDFLKPECQALKVPKLDEQVQDHGQPMLEALAELDW